MVPTDRIPRADFVNLIARTSRALDMAIDRGDIVFWYQRPPHMKSPGTLGSREFIAIDAVLIALSDIFVERGVRREGVSLALAGMQLALPSGVDRPDTKMMISIGRDGKRLGVGCGTLDELRSFELFVGETYQTSWRLSVAPAVETVLARAREHKIELPQTFAPPASEPPLRARGGIPWKYRSADGGFVSEWSPTVQFVQVPATLTRGTEVRLQ